MSAVYKVTCPTCGRPFDALKAADCDCLETVRSLRCPNCAACFCKAPQAFKSTFWRDAPRELVERRKVQPPPTGQVEPISSGITRPLVLFAEDDATARSIARRVIKTLKRGIITAKDGEEALAMARQFLPDLVITDALMPKLDGREVARIIKVETPGQYAIYTRCVRNNLPEPVDILLDGELIPPLCIISATRPGAGANPTKPCVANW